MPTHGFMQDPSVGVEEEHECTNEVLKYLRTKGDRVDVELRSGVDVIQALPKDKIAAHVRSALSPGIKNITK
jgi:hypothetical protein